MAEAKWPARYAAPKVRKLGKALDGEGKPSIEAARKKAKEALAESPRRTDEA